MYAIAQLTDVAFFPGPQRRPTWNEPVGERRLRRGRLQRLLDQLWVAADERYLPLIVRQYPY